ncbi:MAG TPA: TolC family protein, partial [Sulfuricurvum sp.]|nr:TolC family protein [Sulfuricurvum sp.]
MKQKLGALMIAFLFSGCSTISQNNVFDKVKQLTSNQSMGNLQWIKTQEEAASINESVNTLLSHPLSQENAVRIALINNRALQQTYEEIGISQSELVQAGLMSNPLFGYSIGRGGGVTTSTVSVDLAFLDLLWIPLRRELGGLALEETKYRVGDEVLKTILEVKKSYIDARVAQEQVALFSIQMKSHEASFQLAIRQNTAGNLSKRDFLKIQDNYAYARLEAIHLQRENAVARETLNRLLGVYGMQTHYTLETQPLKLFDPLKTEAGLERYAIEHRLDMNAAIARVDYAAAQAGYAKNTRLLSEAEVSAQSEKSTDTNHFNTFGIKIPIPLFDFGQGRVSHSRALYNQSVHRLHEVAVNIRSQVREAYALSRYTYEGAREMDEVIVPVNGQILRETQLFYNGMLDGIYELLEDQRRYGEAQMRLSKMIGEAQKAQANLEYTLGGDANARDQ